MHKIVETKYYNKMPHEKINIFLNFIIIYIQHHEYLKSPILVKVAQTERKMRYPNFFCLSEL